jgi:phosphate-selective porin
MASAACGGDVPQSAFGLLMTAGVHVPEMMKMNTIHDIIPFIQYQKIRPQDEVGDGATYVPQSNYDVFTVGVAYKPDPKVALKANYVTKYYGGTEAANARYGDAGSSGSAFNMAVAYQY